ncbi:hypothetical protein Ae201684P_021119 [Aphanomyces euteiches]|uniref:NADH:flavin oxidoreductase/NADH oxidase N-terminal domain-containing protein n=1 Tax=Aphanomyces euteiches TaxID=100861 RepID=A0A6G0WGY0_9STRA|nr:hypothetical protein Ae201684_015307 [Aphanomyces euteiches]KAH9071982.1 hypothetical protein Ae201684P_021119 [Aphanomyces euteiches]
MAADLFTPIQVGSLVLKNRIFMAPLLRRRTDPDNVPSALMKEYYVQRASAGLIVSECNLIASQTSAYTDEPGVFTAEQLAAWKEITDAVHAKGGKIFAQLWHAGRRAHPNNNDGAANVGPSPIAISGDVYTTKGMAPHAVPSELSVDEIAAIVGQFATAATNAVDVAGFDGVEIHAVNGYLLDQFLRTSSNKRTDLYGDAQENRSRFLAEVLHAVAAAVGADKVGLRVAPLNSYNDVKDDDPLALSQEIAAVAQRAHVAYVHVFRNDQFDLQHGDILPIFRQHFHRTLLGNSGYTKEEANAAIQGGLVDAVAFGQLFVANPDLPERFHENAPMNTPDVDTFYTGGARGYIDYPALQ